ncbi:Os10g0358900 [Oryza sativa Japonica Group]|uniref:DUF569 domain-containing protein n=3 Tax=Oryza sativa TaxID=4530 RepID=A0A8J8XJ47_ORYSJ|nr:hypothetical protein [Oryza sativa Japonica Group]AAL79351.1 Hypothetical protein [Oryza sativa]AAP53280.1 hypothetical protein LOC_Os10g21490 [Oryza sativa Japonica Group]EAZ15783.1 hypothetical protein OsJ_31202 [Oryza sativa Japonica Group]BAT10489.1 Os10g0358900 [Oryza sativa Japonica Group]
MEVFRGVEFAALRLWPCGSFLHADEDGRSVYHGSVRDGDAWLPNAVWAVEELVAGASHTRYVLLRGAYGRYLGAGAPDARDRDQERCACPLPSCPLPCCSLQAAQRDRDDAEPDDIMWRPIGCSGTDIAGSVVLLQDRSGRYLRGNQGFLSRHHGVSVDVNIGNEMTLRWEVVRVRVPTRPERPIVPHLPCWPLLNREIQFVTVDDADNFGFGSVRFTGRSVDLLREDLMRRIGYDDFTMCVRAGRHGRLTPLFIDLPHSRETLCIVLIRPNTPVNDRLLTSILKAEDDATKAAAVELQHRQELLWEREEALRVRTETALRRWEGRLQGRERATRVREDASLQRWMEGLGRRELALTQREERVSGMEATHRAATSRDKPSAPLLKKEDNIWEKRQMSLSISLLTPLALLFSVRPLIPAEYDHYILMAFIAIWGLGSLAFQFGLFGSNSGEKSFSRFVFISFTALVLYTLHLEMMEAKGYSAAPLSPLADVSNVTLFPVVLDDQTWTVIFWIYFVLVLSGHLYAWATAYITGSDKDLE